MLVQTQQRLAVPKVAGGAERAREAEKPGAKGGWGGQSGWSSQNGRLARCQNDKCQQSGHHVGNVNPTRKSEVESDKAGAKNPGGSEFDVVVCMVNQQAVLAQPA